MVRKGIVAGEPDHTGLGWLSRQLQRRFNKPDERHRIEHDGITLRFEQLHRERPALRDRYDVLLGLVADFSITIGDRLLYREVDFPVVELAAGLLRWLEQRPEPGDDFEWESMETEEPGWVWVRSVGDGWRIGSIHQEYPELRSFSMTELQWAITDFVSRLSATALEEQRVDLAPYLRSRLSDE
jgi:hypothetical protein